MGGARNVTVRMKELLMSRPKLERVVGEFGLYPDVRSELGMGEAVEELKKHIEYRAPGGDTFSIAFTGRSPDEVQGVTKRLAALVIEQDSELRKNQARVTRDFLAAEKAKTEATLRSAERELAAFMAVHPRFALDVTPLATGAAIRATTPGVVPGAQPGPARMTVFVPRRVAPGGAPPAAGAPRPMVATTVDADSEIARANAAVAAARANLAEQLERYTPAHPDVRAATAAVERAESRLSTLAGRASRSGSGRSRTDCSPAPEASTGAPAPRSPPRRERTVARRCTRRRNRWFGTRCRRSRDRLAEAHARGNGSPAALRPGLGSALQGRHRRELRKRRTRIADDRDRSGVPTDAAAAAGTHADRRHHPRRRSRARRGSRADSRRG